MPGCDLLTTGDPPRWFGPLSPMGLTTASCPPESLAPRPLPACPPGAGSVAPEAVRVHTHAQLQQEEGWSERKEHWTTTRD